MITLAGLTKRYGDKLAVDHLTFDVLPGRVTGFLGPNGAGKSTTMRLILGLDAPTAVTVGGRRYRSLRRPLHEVGSLLESAAIYPGRSARGHLLALAYANGIGRRRVGEVLGVVGLDGVAGKRAGTFSLGMTQRLGVAAALLGDPPVLLLDEPVNGLDPDGVAWIRGLLRSLAAEGRTVLVSSHLMSEMEHTAGHLIVIGRGRLIADTSLAEFTRTACAGWVQVRSPQQDHLAGLLRGQGATAEAGPGGGLIVRGAAAADVGELAARHGIAVHELVARQASLEQAFMELTRDAADYQPHTLRLPERRPDHDSGGLASAPGGDQPRRVRPAAGRPRARGVDQAAHAAVQLLDDAGRGGRHGGVRRAADRRLRAAPHPRRPGRPGPGVLQRERVLHRPAGHRRARRAGDDRRVRDRLDPLDAGRGAVAAGRAGRQGGRVHRRRVHHRPALLAGGVLPGAGHLRPARASRSAWPLRGRCGR